MERYDWWGTGGKQPPAHLKTTKQLTELGLKPLQPVGFIKTRKYEVLLYDPSDPTSAAPKQQASDAQKAALAKGAKTQWIRRHSEAIADRNAAVRWAKQLIESPDWVVLDTETTGLSEKAEIIQLAVLSPDREILLDSLVRPTCGIAPAAFRIHGISNEMLASAPSFPEICPQLRRALKGKKIIIYNAEFDCRIVTYCCKLHGLKSLALAKRSECAMKWYARFVGQRRERGSGYEYQRLGGDHTAVGDCLKVLDLIQEMAAYEALEPGEEYERMMKAIAQLELEP